MGFEQVGRLADNSDWPHRDEAELTHGGGARLAADLTLLLHYV